MCFGYRKEVVPFSIVYRQLLQRLLRIDYVVIVYKLWSLLQFKRQHNLKNRFIYDFIVDSLPPAINLFENLCIILNFSFLPKQNRHCLFAFQTFCDLLLKLLIQISIFFSNNFLIRNCVLSSLFRTESKCNWSSSIISKDFIFMFWTTIWLLC